MEIERGEDTIELELNSKPDVKFDENEIRKCLEYTKGTMQTGRQPSAKRKQSCYSIRYASYLSADTGRQAVNE